MAKDIFVALTLIFSVLTLPAIAAYALDARLFNGVNVWIKPIKFLVSMVVMFATLAWALTVAPGATTGQPIETVLAIALGVLAAGEIAYIALQAGQASASHYNTSTPFHRAMYGVMGIAAVTMLTITGIFGAMILTRVPWSEPLPFAAGVGLVLGSLLGTITGLQLGAAPGHWVGGTFPGGVPTDAGGMPLFGWSRVGGDLRVAHFVGMHLMQAVPFAAWIALMLVPASFVPIATVTSAVAGTILTFTVLAEAKAGRPLIAAAGL